MAFANPNCKSAFLEMANNVHLTLLATEGFLIISGSNDGEP